MLNAIQYQILNDMLDIRFVPLAGFDLGIHACSGPEAPLFMICYTCVTFAVWTYTIFNFEYDYIFGGWGYFLQYISHIVAISFSYEGRN